MKHNLLFSLILCFLLNIGPVYNKIREFIETENENKLESNVSVKEHKLIIHTKLGDIKGVFKRTINNRVFAAFIGVPYAKPPKGPLRLQDPVPYGNWTFISATSDKPPCPQFSVGLDGTKNVIYFEDEDCLYLNIYTPNHLKSRKYPVMVFIHGGSYLLGSGRSDFLGPDILMDKDIVLVTINYRLGILGFSSTEDGKLKGNFGMKDQVLALKWVKDNIADYGGNPNNVTLFGQSAGSACVHFHTLSPLSKGLFHRVILMSGTGNNPWALLAPGTVAENTISFAKMVNCSTESSQKLVSCLMNIPTIEFVQKILEFRTYQHVDPMVSFTPVFEPEDEEGSFLTAATFLQNSSIPMIIGVTSEEGIIGYLSYHVGSTDSNINNAALSKFSDEFLDRAPISMLFDNTAYNSTDVAMKIKDYYFKGKRISSEVIPQFINMYSDALFFDGARLAIERNNGPTYVYMFAYKGEYSSKDTLYNLIGKPGLNFKYGIAHGEDMPFLFQSDLILKRPSKLNENDRKMTQEMVDYFTNFATFGNPTPEGKPVNWTLVNTNDYNYLLINGTNTKMKYNFPSDRHSFWKTLNWRSKFMDTTKSISLSRNNIKT